MPQLPVDPLFLTPDQVNKAQAVKNYYQSPTPATFTNGGVVSEAHGLGATPRFFHAYLMCATAEFGYSVGDMVRLDAFDATTGGTVTGALLSALTFTPSNSYYGGNVAVNASNVLTVFARDGVRVLNRTAGSVGTPAIITNANWRIVMVAYL